MGRALTGAWIETFQSSGYLLQSTGRALTGAWIETRQPTRTQRPRLVAPSRARGLKRDTPINQVVESWGRALTGAWIETRWRVFFVLMEGSRPHGRVD